MWNISCIYAGLSPSSFYELVWIFSQSWHVFINFFKNIFIKLQQIIYSTVAFANNFINKILKYSTQFVFLQQICVWIKCHHCWSITFIMKRTISLAPIDFSLPGQGYSEGRGLWSWHPQVQLKYEIGQKNKINDYITLGNVITKVDKLYNLLLILNFRNKKISKSLSGIFIIYNALTLVQEKRIN